MTYIEYSGDKHYADWKCKNDLIIDMNDFYIHGAKGKILRYSAKTDYAMNCYLAVNQASRGYFKQGIDIEELCKNYAKCFYFIVCKGHNGDFDKYLYHVIWFLWKTIKIRECSISPKKIYSLCKLQYLGVHQLPYISRTNRKNHKRYYIEEGYTKENTVNMKQRDIKMQFIAAAIIRCKEEEIEITCQNVQKMYMKIGGPVRNSVGSKSKGSISINTIKTLIEDMKTKSEYKDTVSSMKTKSEWKQMIDLNVKSKDNYNEIVKIYDDVSYGSYRNERSRLKKLS